MPNRPAIPETLRRQVRQECGFGCVFCGAPVYVYDHIVDYAVVKEHASDNLALLCPRHDREKTSGRLHRDLVISKRKNPFNREKPNSPAYPIEPGAHTFWISAGGNCYQMQYEANSNIQAIHPALEINGTDLIGVSFYHDGTALRAVPSVQFFDGTNQPIVALYEGEIMVGLNAWDITFEGKRLTIKQDARNIALQMDISTAALQILAANFVVDQKCVRIDKTGIFVDGLCHPITGITARATGGFLRFDV